METPKLGVIFFHSNIRFLYSDRWIEKSVRSMVDQTIGEFTIYEINYGEDSYTVFENIDSQQDKKFYNQKLDNHAEAMNFILDRAFEDGCEYVFNTNLDDFYSPDRMEKQIVELNKGFDLVSSNMQYIEERDETDVILKNLNLFQFGDIKEKLLNGHNIIAHPVVAYSRIFWKSNRYVPSEIPSEDFLMWKRAISEGFRFSIIDEYLLSYRLHSSQITGDNSNLIQKDKVLPIQNSHTNPQINPMSIK